MKTDTKPNGTRRQWIWIMLMVNIVFILLLIAIGIIALQVGNVLPNNTDIIFVVGKNPSVEIGDTGENGVKKWETGKNVDLFCASYVNGEGVTTVASQNGEKLFAPGVTAKYAFTMLNNGNMAVVSETDVDLVLKVGGESSDASGFPLKVRLYNGSGEYLIGGENEWVGIGDAALIKHVDVLGASSYESYVLELYWAYEGGSDELDTQLGNYSAEKGVTLTMKINSYAEESPDPTLQGGTKIEVQGKEEYGGTVRYLWLILLMVNIAVLVFYIAWLMNKRVNKF